MSYFSKSKNISTLLKVFPEAIRKSADDEVFYIESMGIAFSIFTRSVSFYRFEGYNLIMDVIIKLDYSDNLDYLLTEDDLKYIIIELNDYFINRSTNYLESIKKYYEFTTYLS